MARPDRRGWLAAAPAAALLGLGFVVPFALLLRLSFCDGGHRSGFGIGSAFYVPGTWSLRAWRELLADPAFQEILRFTIGLGFLVAALAVGLALPLALQIARLGSRARALALGAVVLPKLANVLVVLYGLELLLGNAGPLQRGLSAAGFVEGPLDLLHGFAATVVGKTWLILPYAVLILVAGIGRIDPELALAARGLGAGAWRRFARVTLPLALPWLALAFLLSLIFALGAFVSPYLLGGPEQFTLAVDVHRQAFENLHWPRAAAESAAMLATIGAIAAAGRLLRRAPRHGAPS